MALNLGNTAVSKLFLGSSEIQKVYKGDTVIYSGGYEPDYLYFTPSLSNQSIGINLVRYGSNTANIEYSKDKETWTAWTSGSVTANYGEKIYVRGNNPNGVCISESSYITFANSGSYAIECGGNVMTLISYTEEVDTIPCSYCFYKLFAGNSNLKTCPEIPATTLKLYCYRYMFQNCTYIAEAPALPAPIVADGAYYGMFQGCSNLRIPPVLASDTVKGFGYSQMFRSCTALQTAPALPATTLKMYCYNYMFAGCYNLVEGPDLPALTLVEGCYNYMFNGCSRLNKLTCLATDISANICVDNWMAGVASTGTFTKNASMTGWPRTGSGIPSGWTVQDAQ